MMRFQKAEKDSYPNADVVRLPEVGKPDRRFWRCFYSGVILVPAGKGIEKWLTRSREHLIPQSSIYRVKDIRRAMVYASTPINSNIGNMPLAAKLDLARMMRECVPSGEMQNDTKLIQSVFNHCWYELKSDYDMDIYRGVWSDTLKYETSMWDRHVAETRLADFKIEFED